MEEKKTSGRYQWGDKKPTAKQKERILESVANGLKDAEDLSNLVEEDDLAAKIHEVLEFADSKWHENHRHTVI